MDKATIDTYNREAKSIAQLHSTLTPQRIYELIKYYFIKGGKTADIGCGIGRDTHWLQQQGFPTLGIDASVEMLKQAQSLYPTDSFIQDYLPDLNLLPTAQFQNILCSAVLMHLNHSDLKKACSRLIGLLNHDGCLIISFRGTNATDNREKGKLYEPIDTETFVGIFTNNNCEVLVNESEKDATRPLTWQNFVIKK